MDGVRSKRKPDGPVERKRTQDSSRCHRMKRRKNTVANLGEGLRQVEQGSKETESCWVAVSSIQLIEASTDEERLGRSVDWLSFLTRTTHQAFKLPRSLSTAYTSVSAISQT